MWGVSGYAPREARDASGFWAGEATGGGAAYGGPDVRGVWDRDVESADRGSQRGGASADGGCVDVDDRQRARSRAPFDDRERDGDGKRARGECAGGEWDGDWDHPLARGSPPGAGAGDGELGELVDDRALLRGRRPGLFPGAGSRA